MKLFLSIFLCCVVALGAVASNTATFVNATGLPVTTISNPKSFFRTVAGVGKWSSHGGGDIAGPSLPFAAGGNSGPISYNLGGAGADCYWQISYIVNGVGPVHTWISPILAGNGSSVTVTLTGTDTNGCQQIVSATPFNNTLNAQDYQWYNISTGAILASTDVTIPPGTAATVSVTVNCDDANNMALLILGNAGAGTQTQYPNTIPYTVGGSSGAGAGTGGTPNFTPTVASSPVSQPSPIVYNPTNNGATNGQLPIIFTQGTNNPTLANEQGDSAIFDAVNKFAQQNHIDLSTVVNQLSADTNFLGQLTGIERAGFSNLLLNLSGLGNSNAVSFSNYNLQSTQVGMSNLLSQIESNTAPTFTNLWSLFPTTATNAAAAQSAATTALGDYGIDGFITSWTTTLPANPSAPDMTISFAGHVYDCDPNHLAPSVSIVALGGWTIILTLAFFLDMSFLFWRVVKVESSQQTGGVPNLDVAGFNVAGLIVFLIIPFVFVSLWTAVLAYLFANLGVSVSSALGIGAWASSMGAIGYYLLTSFFPVSLFFSLLISRITLSFGMAKIVVVASYASRWVMGK